MQVPLQNSQPNVNNSVGDLLSLLNPNSIEYEESLYWECPNDKNVVRMDSTDTTCVECKKSRYDFELKKIELNFRTLT